MSRQTVKLDKAQRRLWEWAEADEPINKQLIFVSSREDEFRAKRSQLRESKILRKNFEVYLQEYTDSGQAIIDSIRSGLRNCSLFYLLLGQSYGTKKIKGRSWIDWEYQAAWIRNKKTRRPLIGISRVVSVAPDPDLQEFLDEIRDVSGFPVEELEESEIEEVRPKDKRGKKDHDFVPIDAHLLRRAMRWLNAHYRQQNSPEESAASGDESTSESSLEHAERANSVEEGGNPAPIRPRTKVEAGPSTTEMSVLIAGAGVMSLLVGAFVLSPTPILLAFVAGIVAAFLGLLAVSAIGGSNPWSWLEPPAWLWRGRPRRPARSSTEKSGGEN